MNIKEAKDILDYWLPKDGTPDYNKWFLKRSIRYLFKSPDFS